MKNSFAPHAHALTSQQGPTPKINGPIVNGPTEHLPGGIWIVARRNLPQRLYSIAVGAFLALLTGPAIATAWGPLDYNNDQITALDPLPTDPPTAVVRLELYNGNNLMSQEGVYEVETIYGPVTVFIGVGLGPETFTVRRAPQGLTADPVSVDVIDGETGVTFLHLGVGM